MRRSNPIILACCAVLCACGTDQPAQTSPPAPLVQFDTALAEIRTATDTFQMRVELADTEERRQYGLMDRSGLDAQSGMLFTYDSLQDSTAGFWMFRTRVPLDIAFMDSAGVVVAILSMEPCQVNDARVCRHSQYSPRKPFQSALEVNRGFFAERGIRDGSTITRVH